MSRGKPFSAAKLAKKTTPLPLPPHFNTRTPGADSYFTLRESTPTTTFGLVLICLCYCIGNISGCHVNPAVSFAMWLSGNMKGKDCVMYIIFQLIGATIGAGFLYRFTDMAPDFKFGGITGDNNLATNVLQPGPIFSIFASSFRGTSSARAPRFPGDG